MEIEYLIEKIVNAIPLAIPVFIATNNIRVIAKAKLQRRGFNGEVVYGVKSIFRKLPDISFDKIDYKNREILKVYVERLSKHIPLEDMKLVYKNINSVKVEKNLKPLLHNAIGYYEVVFNEISFLEPTVLSHEFLHLASSVYDKRIDMDFSGFSQQGNKSIIGNGINEGYTQVLNERIYGVNPKKEAYYNEYKIAKMIELFFDNKEDMQHLYFNCDLPGLVEQLEKYASYEEIVKLITDIDDYSVYDEKNILLAKLKKISIYKRIYGWFIAKSNNQEKIDKFEAIIDEDKLVSSIIRKQKMKLYRNSPYEIINDEEIVKNKKR